MENQRCPNLKLKAAIVESGKTFREVAREINMPMTTLSRKINGHAQFTESEISFLCNAVSKEPQDLFFNECVTKAITNNSSQEKEVS